VPLPLPDTIRVKERLPAGATAVLINPAHTFTDLFMPIDDVEERLFDAIDGERTIGDIARSQGLLDRAAPFFERLYEHDQIVLRTAGQGAPAP